MGGEKKFIPSWLSEFKWLSTEGNKKDGSFAMFCHVCRAHATGFAHSNAFVNGTQNWSHNSLIRHAQTDTHKENQQLEPVRQNQQADEKVR